MIKRSKFSVFLLLGLGFTLLGFKCNQTPSSVPETNSFLSYTNKKHRFNLEYPLDWFLSGDADADIVHLTSVSENLALGGPPSGARLEIIILDNPEGFSLRDWVRWIKTEGSGQGLTEDKEIIVAGQKAIQQTGQSPPGPVGQGRPISIYLAKGNQIVQINYLGREPAYSENQTNFEAILRSFQFF